MALESVAPTEAMKNTVETLPSLDMPFSLGTAVLTCALAAVIAAGVTYAVMKQGARPSLAATHEVRREAPTHAGERLEAKVTEGKREETLPRVTDVPTLLKQIEAGEYDLAIRTADEWMSRSDDLAKIGSAIGLFLALFEKNQGFNPGLLAAYRRMSRHESEAPEMGLQLLEGFFAKKGVPVSAIDKAIFFSEIAPKQPLAFPFWKAIVKGGAGFDAATSRAEINIFSAISWKRTGALDLFKSLFAYRKAYDEAFDAGKRAILGAFAVATDTPSADIRMTGAYLLNALLQERVKVQEINALCSTPNSAFAVQWLRTQLQEVRAQEPLLFAAE